MNFLGEFGMIMHVSEVVWILDNHAAELISLTPIKVFSLSHNHINTQSVAFGLDYVKGLGEH